MSWINFIVGLLFLVGIILIIIGIKHHKSWIWGLMLIIFAIIIRAFVWFSSML